MTCECGSNNHSACSVTYTNRMVRGEFDLVPETFQLMWLKGRCAGLEAILAELREPGKKVLKAMIDAWAQEPVDPWRAALAAALKAAEAKDGDITPAPPTVAGIA